MSDDFLEDKFLLQDGIQGLGIIAKKDFKKGEVLFKLTGKIVPLPTRTSVQIRKHQHIENPISSHVNHSCTPNAKVCRKSLTFVALKDIHAGDEITFDYSKNEDEMACPFVCHCCNKWIEGKKKKIESL